MRVLIAAVLATFWLENPRTPEFGTQVIKLERNRFTPATIRARAGDTLRFVNGEGGPHNVEFEKDSVPSASRPLIEAVMGPNKIGPMSSMLLILAGETWTFVVPALPAGRYAFLCTPHWGNMRGALIVD
jgi:plastocyanin